MPGMSFTGDIAVGSVRCCFIAREFGRRSLNVQPALLLVIYEVYSIRSDDLTLTGAHFQDGRP